MFTGTSIEILLDYKDGSNDTFYKGLLVAWMPGEKHIQTHTFTTGGEFSVEITIKNNFDTFTFTKEIIVYNSVSLLTSLCTTLQSSEQIIV